MSRPQAWLIKSREGYVDDVYDVLHGRRMQVSGLSTINAALDTVKQHRNNPAERVWLEEDDGYRVEVTDRVTPAPSRAQARISHRDTEVPDDPDRPARTRYLARYGKSRRPGRWF